MTKAEKIERVKALFSEADQLSVRMKEIEAELATFRKYLQPTPRYTRYSINTVKLNDGPFDELPSSVISGIKIVNTLSNADEKDEFLSYFRSISGSWNETTTSVTYYRYNNVLLHTGGGHLILKTPIDCSDEEWEAICRNEIPERFFNKRFQC